VTDWNKFISHRVLIKENPAFCVNKIIEAEVIEVSPSGKYVKLRIGDSTTWVPANRYEIVEDLGVPPPTPEREILWGK